MPTPRIKIRMPILLIRFSPMNFSRLSRALSLEDSKYESNLSAKGLVGADTGIGCVGTIGCCGGGTGRGGGSSMRLVIGGGDATGAAGGGLIEAGTAGS